MSDVRPTNLVTELRAWVGWPKKELDVLLEQAAEEIERLRAALKQVGDDYPGSSCQRWCYQQAGFPDPEANLT